MSRNFLVYNCEIFTFSILNFKPSLVSKVSNHHNSTHYASTPSGILSLKKCLLSEKSVAWNARNMASKVQIVKWDKLQSQHLSISKSMRFVCKFNIFFQNVVSSIKNLELFCRIWDSKIGENSQQKSWTGKPSVVKLESYSTYSTVAQW